MRANLAGDRTAPKARRVGFRRTIGNICEPTGVTGLDFISQWGALTIRDGEMAGRRRGAGFLQYGGRDLGKSRLGQFIANYFDIVMPVRRPGEKPLWVIGKHDGGSVRYNRRSGPEET